MFGYGYGYGMDMSYLLLVLISSLLGFAAQYFIKSAYSSWSRVPVNTGETGEQVARRMLASFNADSVGFASVAGTLTDHYDPRDNNLYLSQENRYGGSVASMAVACHEAGHAIQNAENYAPMRFRTALVPVVNFTSQTWMIVFFAGVMLNIMGFIKLAVALFAFSVLFHLVTLPVEIDASRRAMEFISHCGIDENSQAGARRVLTAAALTYVAAALTSILQLLYYAGRTNRRR